MDLNSWAAIIPAYNAAGTIRAVIDGVRDYVPPDRILVVDDGSTDPTADEVHQAGGLLLQRSDNGGKGRALRDGFRRVLEWVPEWIICLDADGQHDPAAIPLFQQAAAGGQYDLIIGNRRGSLGKMPLIRRFSNVSSSGLMSLRTGMKLPDAQCGYRTVRTELLRRMNLRAERYDIEAEMILEAWRLKGRIGWISIPALYRGEPSFIHKVPETVRFLKVMARSFHA